MSESKPTKGPWHVGYNGGVTGSGACYHEWSERLKSPVVYAGQGEYHAANPRPVILISGAPSGNCNLVVAHVIPEPDSYFGGTNGEANAMLIAEAGTVHHETGLTPRQLAEQRKELFEALKACLSCLEVWIEESAGSDLQAGPEDFDAVKAAHAAILKAEGRE
jgi:hypothetical protein